MRRGEYRRREGREEEKNRKEGEEQGREERDRGERDKGREKIYNSVMESGDVLRQCIPYHHQHEKYFSISYKPPHLHLSSSNTIIQT